MKKSILYKLKKNFFSILVGLYPAALAAGTSISEIINFTLIFFFLRQSYISRNWSWTKDKLFLLLLIIYFYLIINSLLSNYPQESYLRALGFIRFPILIFCVCFVFQQNENSEKIIFKMWFAILTFLIIDLYYESIFGHNIIGYESPWKERLAGMLFGELKIAHLLIGFTLPTLFFIFESNKNVKKLILYIFLFTIILVLTGERANTLKGLFAILLALILYKNKFYSFKKLYLIFFIITFMILIYLKPNIHQRYYLEISNAWNLNNKSIVNLIKNSNYGPHYQVAWSIFQNYPILGSGLKTFRFECKKEKYSKYNGCTTHPHQIYFEFLSEIGILGFLLIAIFFVYIIRRSKINITNNNSGTKLSAALFILASIIPFVPSGSFFTSFGATIFWINVALIIRSDKNNA